MARSYEFPNPIKDKQALFREVGSVANANGLRIDYHEDRIVLRGSGTEYIVTTRDITETGNQNPAYDALKSIVKPLSGVTHG